MPVSGETPVPSGPRKRGQSEPAADRAATGPSAGAPRSQPAARTPTSARLDVQRDEAKRPAIEESLIAELEGGDDQQGHESQRHERRPQRCAEVMGEAVKLRV